MRVKKQVQRTRQTLNKYPFQRGYTTDQLVSGVRSAEWIDGLVD